MKTNKTASIMFKNIIIPQKYYIGFYKFEYSKTEKYWIDRLAQNKTNGF